LFVLLAHGLNDGKDTHGSLDRDQRWGASRRARLCRTKPG
jgi:hypothetical protein